jgi:hypothetical protein
MLRLPITIGTIYTIRLKKRKLALWRSVDDELFWLQHVAGRSEAAAAAVAAGAAEVPRVGRVGGPGTVSLSPVLSVVLTVRTLVTSSQLFHRWGTPVGRDTPVGSRADRPASFPARQARVVGVILLFIKFTIQTVKNVKLWFSVKIERIGVSLLNKMIAKIKRMGIG